LNYGLRTDYRRELQGDLRDSYNRGDMPETDKAVPQHPNT
jgi:hypothetical protein